MDLAPNDMYNHVLHARCVRMLRGYYHATAVGEILFKHVPNNAAWAGAVLTCQAVQCWLYSYNTLVFKFTSALEAPYYKPSLKN